jgi:serine/threonine-protein kinase
MLGIAVLFVLGVAAYIGVSQLTGAPDKTVAPTLINRTEEEARRLLADAQLQLGQINREASDTVPEGSVISQNPSPGDSVDINSAINITVSTGKEQAEIPADVIGLQLEEARTLLTTRGFEVVDREDPESDEDAGTVTRTDPEAGTSVPRGSTVTIYYSSGLVEVPDVVGESQSRAEAILEDAGFEPRPVYEETTSESEGTVIDQVPGEGSRREKGSTVQITIAVEPEEEEPQPSTEPEPDPSTTSEPPEETPPPTESPAPPETPDPTTPPDGEWPGGPGGPNRPGGPGVGGAVAPSTPPTPSAGAPGKPPAATSGG